MKEKSRRGPRWRTEISDESKKTSTHTYIPVPWYLARCIIPVGTLCVLKKAQGSAPRAADAARYARARKNATKYVKGAERRGPFLLLGANSGLIMPRGDCAELIALRCAVRY